MHRKLFDVRRVLVVTELFNVAVIEFDAKESAHSRRMLVVTELVISGTQYVLIYVEKIGLFLELTNFIEFEEKHTVTKVLHVLSLRYVM